MIIRSESHMSCFHCVLIDFSSGQGLNCNFDDSQKYTGLPRSPKNGKIRTKKQCFEEEKQKLCAKKVENTDFSC